jgi:hypothetical protein
MCAYLLHRDIFCVLCIHILEVSFVIPPPADFDFDKALEVNH